MNDRHPLNDENPEWTAEDFAKARPASELHSPSVLQALVREKPARGLPVALHGQDALARGWSLAA
jgi:hypothetical protein